MRLVTWNTQWCKGLDGVVSVERIIDGARALADFDVLCLQEIAQNYPQLTGDTPADQPAEIAKALPGFEVVFGAAIDERPPGGAVRQRFGNLIASRLPVLQVHQLALPSPASDGEPHPWMPRLCTVCTVQAAWGPVRVMTTHLEYYSESHRVAQARALRQWHAAFCGQSDRPPPVPAGQEHTPYQPKPYTSDAVLCGDFNSEPNSPPYEVLTTPDGGQPFDDAWPSSRPGEDHPPTFRLFDDTFGPTPVAVDFWFVSRSLSPRLIGVEVDTSTRVSDHQPVAVTFR
jgi:endonuclease/exonuclease/phosphatase family metal-dependent hydrolase